MPGRVCAAEKVSTFVITITLLSTLNSVNFSCAVHLDTYCSRTPNNQSIQQQQEKQTKKKNGRLITNSNNT